MTAVLWDQIGSRRFEGGCDRGVLYLPDGTAVPWNGLTAVTDDTTDTTIEEYFLDGVKYLNRRIVGDYSGTLKAVTYPDEFLEFDGFQEYGQGIFVTGQPVGKTFGLVYRTKVGNDTSGNDYGYKLHLLYNLTAKPDTRTYSTESSSISAEEFSWTLAGVPVTVLGYRPMVHLIIDSTKVIDGAMVIFEDMVYGSDTTDPFLPQPSDLMAILADLISEPIDDLF